MKRRYVQGFDGDWVRPVMRGYKVACCDCGLVHRYDFRLVRVGKQMVIVYRAFRDRRATAARRRRKSLAKVKKAVAR